MRPLRGPLLPTLRPEWGPLWVGEAEAPLAVSPGTASAAPGAGFRSCTPAPHLPGSALAHQGLLPALPEPDPHLEGRGWAWGGQTGLDESTALLGDSVPWPAVGTPPCRTPGERCEGRALRCCLPGPYAST